MRRTRSSRNTSQNTAENGEVNAKTGWCLISLTFSHLVCLNMSELKDY